MTIDPVSPPAKRPRGRPRSESAREQILQATLDLLEAGNLRDITAEAIARKAGVSKATLYKWWPNKLHIAFDAFMARMSDEIVVPDTGSSEHDFLMAMRDAMAFYSSAAGRTLAQLIAEGQGDETFNQALLESFLNQRREAVATIWRRGVERGDLRSDIDMQMGLDLIYGPLMFRFLAGRFHSMNAEEADKLIAIVFRGITPVRQTAEAAALIDA
ncbi:TetR/AcrR family transcriptional regulator [Asticcacaulis sp. DW145]|jgi:AcrR family transcriptional regulator|uniref:TetR/AcrR family transcriptional regulator n=1 Tax=Asticcacaulis currens TaxID=2984210 RepID=A0ABT5IEN4_9CAUL|nr:TetR/AcrR family transcriptional regulator [Asticcacaulis currens]MDC7694641.1 TetR/AcrR family transcriptional regulator [Asticcacaulis currens]BEV11066.1 TetR/AcrR family transcriptional regulator [Asticcacaulis sp. DW145]